MNKRILAVIAALSVAAGSAFAEDPSWLTQIQTDAGTVAGYAGTAIVAGLGIFVVVFGARIVLRALRGSSK